MLFFVLDRSLNVIQSVSDTMETGFWLDDTTGGQKLSIVSGCVVGTYSFTINASAPEAKAFQPGNYIVFKDKYNKTRMYTIMSTDGDDEITCECEDCGLDLLNSIIGPFDFSSSPVTLDKLLTPALYNTGWTYVIHPDSTTGRDITKEARQVELTSNDTVLKRLEDLCLEYNVEMDFEVEFNRNMVTSQVVHVHESISKDPTKIVKRYMNDIDLNSLSANKSISELYTAIELVNGEVTISDMVYDDGNYYTIKGDKKLYARTANKVWSRLRQFGAPDGGYIVKYESGNGNTPEALLAEARSLLQANSTVKFSYSVNVLDIGANIGDYIQIVDTSKADPIYLSARVTEVINHYINPNEDECVVSNYQMLTPSKSNDIQKIISEIKEQILTKTKADKIDYAIGDSGIQPPAEDKWTDLAHLPLIKAGQFQWTRRTEYYSDGSTAVSYNIAKSEAARIPKIVETKYLYQLGQNGSTIPNGIWVETRPTATEDKPYIWTKTIDIYDTPDTRIEHYTVIKDGIQGKNGRSIEKQCTQYYLSTSKDNVVGGTWVDNNVPVRKVDTYIFKREYTRWSDGVENVTDPLFDEYHNAQYDSITNLYRTMESDSSQLKTQLGRIEKLESTTSDYESVREKVNETISTYSDTIQQFTTTVNGIKEITAVIKTNEEGINIAKPNDPSGLSNQLGSKGFEVTKPTITGTRVTVLKADEQGVYASSFKAVDSMSFGSHRAEFYRMDEIDGSKNVDGTGYFWIGDVR